MNFKSHKGRNFLSWHPGSVHPVFPFTYPAIIPLIKENMDGVGSLIFPRRRRFSLFHSAHLSNRRPPFIFFGKSAFSYPLMSNSILSFNTPQFIIPPIPADMAYWSSFPHDQQDVIFTDATLLLQSQCLTLYKKLRLSDFTYVAVDLSLQRTLKVLFLKIIDKNRMYLIHR